MIMGLELLKAMFGMAIILVVWLAVQRAWRGVFPGVSADEDALAGRMDCHGCTCETPCENRQLARNSAQETL